MTWIGEVRLLVGKHLPSGFGFRVLGFGFISGPFWIYTKRNSLFCHTHAFANLQSEPVGGVWGLGFGDYGTWVRGCGLEFVGVG